MTVKKICCFGLGPEGVPLSVAIAVKCPEIKVVVVHADPEDIFLWSAKQIPVSASTPGLADLIRKCQNRNLFFTKNVETSVKEADLIFIISQSKQKTSGEGQNEVLDMSEVDHAAQLVAEYSDSDKIVVESSAVPLRTAERVREILKHNSHPGVNFEVLSNPEFYEEGSSIQNLLFPSRILIGCDRTPEGIAAAKELSFIYEHWVPFQKILTKDVWTIELSKIVSSVFAALKLTNFYALSAICEETNCDIIQVARSMGIISRSDFGLAFPEGNKLQEAVSNLIYMCERIGCRETADFWRQLPEMNAFHKDRFLRCFLWTLNQTLYDKKLAVLGFAFFKDTAITRGSVAVDFCRFFLKERAVLSIYDPNVSKKQVVDELRAVGCDAPQLQKNVSVHVDPYKALFGCQIIVACSVWPELAHLDFSRIFGEMMKPAYVFDLGNFLPHSELTKIGFKVYAVGKSYKNPDHH